MENFVLCWLSVSPLKNEGETGDTGGTNGVSVNEEGEDKHSLIKSELRQQRHPRLEHLN